MSLGLQMSEEALQEFINNTSRLEMHENNDSVRSSVKTFATVLINLGFDEEWVEKEARPLFARKMQDELSKVTYVLGNR